jgi:hypothetical protein
MQYRPSKESLEKFQEAILQTLKNKFNLNHKSTPELDDFNEAIKMVSNRSFPPQRSSRHTLPHKSIPWWTADLTVLRKGTNALCRLYKRTKNNVELRDKRKTQYFESKSTYAATIKREKLRYWKEFCKVSTATNP